MGAPLSGGKNHRRSASQPPTESYAMSETPPLPEGSGFSLPSTEGGEGQAPAVSNRGHNGDHNREVIPLPGKPSLL
jgi:hypothetical protein